MILMLLQSAHHHHSHNPLHPDHPDWHRASVDGIPAGLLPAHGIRRSETRLVGLELAVQQPGAAPEAQDAVPLAQDPGLVVGGGAGSRGALKDDLGVVGQGDGDDDGAGWGQRAEFGVEKVAKVPDVLRREGLEGEGVTVSLELVDLEPRGSAQV